LSGSWAVRITPDSQISQRSIRSQDRCAPLSQARPSASEPAHGVSNARVVRVKIDSNTRKGPPTHWLIIATTALLLGLVAAFVDLPTHVDEQFFFSSDDPQLQETNKIHERFPSGSQLILSVSSADISSERYLDRLRQLTEQIASIASVTGVRSLADGPKDLA